MDKMTPSDIIIICTSLLSGLLVINAWFIMRLVDKIDSTSVGISEVQLSQSELKKSHESLAERVKDLSDLSSRLQSIERQHAVFDFVMRERMGHQKEVNT